MRGTLLLLAQHSPMAPKVSKKLTAAQIAATTSPSAASTSGAEEPTKVNLYDAASLKSTLDDCAHEVS